MRRWLCALQIGALLPVLWCGVASASMNSFDPPAVDLGARLFAKCFGESTDRLASYSAVTGDPVAESPLRDLALRFDPESPALIGFQNVQLPAIDETLIHPGSFTDHVVNLSDAAYTPRSLQSAQVSADLHASVIGYYQSAAPAPTDAPLSHRFDLAAWHLNSAPPAFALTTPVNADGGGVEVPLHLGHVQFSPHAQAGFTQDPQPAPNDRSFIAGATLNVRAGRRNVGLDLSSGLENATLSQPQFSAATSPAVGITGESLPVFVPAYADVSAHTISTGVTVPVTRSLTANLQYDTQHLLSAYGAPGQNSLDANNTIYGAQLTFKLPKGSSAISLSARQYHYQDNLVPSNAVTQTNANLNYTVKF